MPCWPVGKKSQYNHVPSAALKANSILYLHKLLWKWAPSLDSRCWNKILVPKVPQESCSFAIDDASVASFVWKCDISSLLPEEFLHALVKEKRDTPLARYPIFPHQKWGGNELANCLCNHFRWCSKLTTKVSSDWFSLPYIGQWHSCLEGTDLYFHFKAAVLVLCMEERN